MFDCGGLLGSLFGNGFLPVKLQGNDLFMMGLCWPYDKEKHCVLAGLEMKKH